jgi:Ca2+/Na+ antiporter
MSFLRGWFKSSPWVILALVIMGIGIVIAFIMSDKIEIILLVLSLLLLSVCVLYLLWHRKLDKWSLSFFAFIIIVILIITGYMPKDTLSHFFQAVIDYFMKI